MPCVPSSCVTPTAERSFWERRGLCFPACALYSLFAARRPICGDARALDELNPDVRSPLKIDLLAHKNLAMATPAQRLAQLGVPEEWLPPSPSPEPSPPPPPSPQPPEPSPPPPAPPSSLQESFQSEWARHDLTVLHDPANHDVVVYSAAHHHGRPLELSPAMGLLPELFVSVTSLTAMSFLAALVLCGHRESRRGARGHRRIPLASAEPVLIAEGWSPTGVRPGEDEEAAVEEAPMLGRAGAAPVAPAAAPVVGVPLLQAV